MHILIVDDELLARNRLRVLLSESEDSTTSFTVQEAASAAQALAVLQRSPLPVDLVLLDTQIQIPGPDSAALAQTLRNMAHPPAIVFVAGHAVRTTHTFKVEAVDCLSKPVRLERLQQTIAKLRRMRASEPSPYEGETAAVLPIRDRGRTECVPLHQVAYLKAEQKYVTVRTAGRTYILDNPLSELEQRYPGQFLRIHRNALVNPSQVRTLEKQYTDEEVECWVIGLYSVPELLQVSRRQLSSVRAALHRPSYSRPAKAHAAAQQDSVGT